MNKAVILGVLVACFLAMLSSFEWSKLPQQKNYRIRTKVLASRDYCGGAAPPEELLESLKKSVPLVDQTLYLKRITNQGIEKMVYKILKTNAQGEISILLPKGSYAVFVAEKVNFKPSTTPVDPFCKQWLNKPDARLTVAKNLGSSDVPYTVKMHLECNPCFLPHP